METIKNQQNKVFFSNLARLVPSTEFEQKRRQINKHLLDEIEKDEEPVLCGKKKKKKKKKKNEDDNEETIMLRIYIILIIGNITRFSGFANKDHFMAT